MRRGHRSVHLKLVALCAIVAAVALTRAWGEREQRVASAPAPDPVAATGPVLWRGTAQADGRTVSAVVTSTRAGERELLVTLPVGLVVADPVVLLQSSAGDSLPLGSARVRLPLPSPLPRGARVVVVDGARGGQVAALALPDSLP